MSPTCTESSRPGGDAVRALWIDPGSFELRWLEYRYQNLNADLSSPEVGGRVDFQRLPNGTWIVPEWWIRMPTIGYVRDESGRRQPYLESYRVSGGIVMEVQESGGRTIVEAETGTIEGIVLDSLGVAPLRGARVGVRGSNQQVFTNAESTRASRCQAACKESREPNSCAQHPTALPRGPPFSGLEPLHSTHR